jgi:Tfp pilus assembly pilus retraction ATPase PilT
MAGEKQFAQDEANLPFRNASAANRLLQEIELSEKTTARAQLAGQLNAIVSKAQTLITQLKGMK